MRVFLLTLALGAGYAPMQCRSEPEYEERRYEQPGEALYRLANQFKGSGMVDAWRTTLEHLIERYPSSRFATMAKDDLAKAGSAAEGSAAEGSAAEGSAAEGSAAEGSAEGFAAESSSSEGDSEDSSNEGVSKSPAGGHGDPK